jgi:hypothetical protein
VSRGRREVLVDDLELRRRHAYKASKSSTYRVARIPRRLRILFKKHSTTIIRIDEVMAETSRFFLPS